jgi:hypothetical protein
LMVVETFERKVLTGTAFPLKASGPDRYVPPRRTPTVGTALSPAAISLKSFRFLDGCLEPDFGRMLGCPQDSYGSLNRSVPGAFGFLIFNQVLY